MSRKHFDPARPKRAADLDLGFNDVVPYINRHDWGSQMRTNVERLDVPATMVRLTTTSGHECKGHETCVATVRNLQLFHLTSGLPDIKHNFLIGGNEVIYEGRGCLFRPILPSEYAQLAATCIEIAFIGSYEYGGPPYDMMRLALDVIRHCIKKQVLHPHFELIPLQK